MGRALLTKWIFKPAKDQGKQACDIGMKLKGEEIAKLSPTWADTLFAHANTALNSTPNNNRGSNSMASKSFNMTKTEKALLQHAMKFSRKILVPQAKHHSYTVILKHFYTIWVQNLIPQHRDTFCSEDSPQIKCKLPSTVLAAKRKNKNKKIILNLSVFCFFFDWWLHLYFSNIVMLGKLYCVCKPTSYQTCVP